MPTTSAPKIYAAIAEVSKNARALAPQKGGAGVPFAFRGVDATVSHVAPHLKEFGIIIVPEVLEAKHSAREVGGNKVVTQTEIRSAFHFISTEDGSEVVATTIGLAQDFSDRSAAQAQSVAFRVAILQTFTLPTTDKEPEEAGEEVQKGLADAARSTPAAPAGPKKKSVSQLSAEIGKLISAGTVTAEQINQYGGEISRADAKVWKADGAILERVLAKFSA